jgi:hypothetical protein
LLLCGLLGGNGLLLGFGGGLLLTLGFGRASTTDRANSRASARTADGANKASFRNTFKALAKIGLARGNADGALAQRFANGFACCTAHSRLANAAGAPANDALGDIADDAGRDLVAKGAAQSLFDILVFDTPNDRARNQGDAASGLRIDTFCGKTLIEFVNAARKKSCARAKRGATSSACGSARKTARRTTKSSATRSADKGTRADTCDGAGSLACVSFEGADCVAAHEVAEFRGARAKVGIALRGNAFADTLDCGGSFGRTGSGSACYSGANRRGNLTAKLLAGALEEAFNGHLAAQRRPLRIHERASFLLRRRALHSDNAPVGKLKVEVTVCHKLTLTLRTRILDHLARLGCWPLLTGLCAALGTSTSGSRAALTTQGRRKDAIPFRVDFFLRGLAARSPHAVGAESKHGLVCCVGCAIKGTAFCGRINAAKRAHAS